MSTFSVGDAVCIAPNFEKSYGSKGTGEVVEVGEGFTLGRIRVRWPKNYTGRSIRTWIKAGALRKVEPGDSQASNENDSRTKPQEQ